MKKYEKLFYINCFLSGAFTSYVLGFHLTDMKFYITAILIVCFLSYLEALKNNE